MSDTNPNHKITPTERRELKEAFAAFQADPSKSGEFVDALRESLGLPEGTEGKDVLLALPRSEAEKVIQRELEKERDDARAELAKVKAERDADKVDSTLRAAFEKSGAGREHLEDFLLLARGLFEVDEKGGVRTRKDAPNTVAGQSADAWIVAELRAKRSHWFPTSVGGGARGAGMTGHRGADDSMFDPASKSYSFTKQLEAEARYGAEFADKARAKYRGRGGTR